MNGCIPQSLQEADTSATREDRLHQAADAFIAVVRRGKHLTQALTEESAEVTPAMLTVLTALSWMQPCRLSDLADHHLLDASTVSRQVDQLVRQGLVHRAPDPDDRRAVRLSTTDAGSRLVLAMNARRSAIWHQVLQEFDDAELDDFVALHLRLLRRLDDLGLPEPCRVHADRP